MIFYILFSDKTILKTSIGVYLFFAGLALTKNVEKSDEGGFGSGLEGVYDLVTVQWYNP